MTHLSLVAAVLGSEQHRLGSNNSSHLKHFQRFHEAKQTGIPFIHSHLHLLACTTQHRPLWRKVLGGFLGRWDLWEKRPWMVLDGKVRFVSGVCSKKLSLSCRGYRSKSA